MELSKLLLKLAKLGSVLVTCTTFPFLSVPLSVEGTAPAGKQITYELNIARLAENQCQRSLHCTKLLLKNQNFNITEKSKCKCKKSTLCSAQDTFLLEHVLPKYTVSYHKATLKYAKISCIVFKQPSARVILATPMPLTS